MEQFLGWCEVIKKLDIRGIQLLGRNYSKFLDKDKTEEEIYGTDRKIWDMVVKGFLEYLYL